MQAAVDTEIEISKSSHTISITKQRDLEPIPELRFKLDRLVVGKDAEGEEVSTCVVRFLKKNEFVRLELSEREQAAFDVLCRYLEETECDAVGAGVWADLCLAQSKLEKLSETSLKRLRATLVQTGHVKEIKRGQYVKA
jgi:hypothetical protein